MEELTRGVRELHQRVAHLDDLLHEQRDTADLREKLGAAAHAQAERGHRRITRLTVAVAAGLLIWTPATSYSAVWTHELIRNECYPVAALTGVLPPGRPEPWYCKIFPGTGHPGH